MRLFGLMGYPLSHSFSKRFFSEKFEKEGLTDCHYDLFPLETIEELPGFCKIHPELLGLNVTVPYKKAVLPYLDSTMNIPRGLNACNCIRIHEGKLVGHNTDSTGFEKSFIPLLKPHHKKVLVLGNGGGTEAVIYVLKKRGFDFAIVSRTIHNGSTITYPEVDRSLIEDHLVIINTTPLGMYPNSDTCPDIPYHFITERHLLYDLVYNPPETMFLQKGKERGATIKNGEEMLLLQAEESWRIWNS